MEYNELKRWAGFYENELTNRFLSFWLPKCVDREYGGFVNCFTNDGSRLVSGDKYVWSQGRFVWVFSKLAAMGAPIFSQEKRDEYLALARHGADFLMKYCLIAPDDWRCVFLLARQGNPKYVEGCDRLDMSVYADCFVVGGLAMYAAQADAPEAYEFAKKLYCSILDRVERNDYQTLPYPLSDGLRAHGIPMILSNISKDVYNAAKKYDPEYSQAALKNMEGFTGDTLEHFVDEDGCLHEVITADNQFFSQLLGNHINPGHTLEDVWFMLDTAELAGRAQWKEKIYRLALKALRTGWDEEYGGILHFASLNGGRPEGDNEGYEDEPMSRQLSGWGDKLWWVHSEALYTTLRCYSETGSEEFLSWHNRLFDYIYNLFPNTDPEIFEWVQIRERDGKPAEKVVALPVKDPYHVMRNLILIIECIDGMMKRQGGK
ncbi:MAG: AGE family epimerase/isomerase [Clostridium sp.]|nr:AGE family epimerase/isomerase [Clostridium sp.]